MKKWMGSLLAATLVLTACTEQQETAPQETAPQESQQQAETEEVAFPLTVTDAVGNEVTLEEAPDAIISMIPSNTEILFALGFEEEVVGVTDYDNYPEAAATKEKIGAFEFNIEKMTALQPDLILAHESSWSTAEAGLQPLQDAGVPIFVVGNAMSFDETYETIEAIGEVTGASEQATTIVEDMQAQVDAIATKLEDVEQQKTVFIESSGDPEIYTAGQGTLMQELLDRINAENVVADQEGWLMMNSEEIVSRNPDVILLTYNYIENAVDAVKTRPGFDQITAVQQDAVIQVNEDITTRPGPRLALALEELAKAVYPEVMND
ncbi:ABC transporter substrate-binding protein [Chryseomicrobium sp. FSL W7-1435]|uniref:ABC transporter substrate-binding protein n=1 Tax=Chryseomicrobium sp. FSL W7-1435 TaxID=2921704 RepID=UPI00315A098F